VRNSHSRTIIWFGSFFDCSAPPQKKGRLVLALPMKEDENGRLGFSNQERHGMHPFEPCLSGKRSFSYLLLEVWFESWCGTPLEKSEWITLFIYDNLGDALSSFPIHEGNCHSSSLESKPFFFFYAQRERSLLNAAVILYMIPADAPWYFRPPIKASGAKGILRRL